jgi:hypothetical protein
MGFHLIVIPLPKVYFRFMQTDNPTPSKLLVRHVSLNKFLSPAGRWVKRAEAAFNFPNLLNAINTCFGRGLQDVELIFRFEGNRPDRRIPLNALE